MSLIVKPTTNFIDERNKINLIQVIIISFIIIIIVNNIRKLNAELKKSNKLNKRKMSELIEIITSDKFVIDGRVTSLNKRFKTIEKIINSNYENLGYINDTASSICIGIIVKRLSDHFEIHYHDKASMVNVTIDQLISFINLKYIKLDNRYTIDTLLCKITCRKGHKYKHLVETECLYEFVTYNNTIGYITINVNLGCLAKVLKLKIITTDNIDLTETFYSKVSEREFNCLKKMIELEQSF
jgi:hypothetical protein